MLIPNTNLRSADVLVQSAAPSPGDAPGKPTAYDITIRSPYTTRAQNHAAMLIDGATNMWDADKLRSFDHAVRESLLITHTAAMHELGFSFVRLAFDTLGAPSDQVIDIVKQHAKQSSMRSASTLATAETRIWQKVSFSVWSSVAVAILARMPALTGT